MQLSAYLDRIGFEGDARPDLATLCAIQRGHMLSIPYENLDVQLGRPLTTDPAAAYRKIVGKDGVGGRRGGWCYEMNGLMGWALKEIGFDVTRVAAGVMRVAWGEAAAANHLVLRVELDGETWLADVGLGCGPLTPFRVTPGAFAQEGFSFALAEDTDGHWRLTNHEGLSPPSFDFPLVPASEAALSAKCHDLQTAPDSIFVQNLIAQRYVDGGFLSLVGKMLKRIEADGQVTTRELSSADELAAVLRDDFGADEPEAVSLWPKVLARHEALFSAA